MFLTAINPGNDTNLCPYSIFALSSEDPYRSKILVVDDHPFSRSTAIALLSIDGYELIEASDGISALECVQQFDPDLILLDIMLPDIDGYEICRRIKQNQQTRLIPVIFVTALSDRHARLSGIEAGGDDFISKPFDQLELPARVRSLVRQKHLNRDLDHAGEILFAIARAVESRDPNTGDHCDRLVTLGKAFGEFLHLSPAQVRDLMWGGYLHDIGKVGIPDRVLLKTGQLTPEEWQIMKQHVIIGEQICQPMRSMKGVLPIIRHHHERWDGSGYPDGLVGRQIPLLAQAFQLIDIYDALTHERPYKPAFSPEESLQILYQETQQGWHDSELVHVFAQFIQSREATLEA